MTLVARASELLVLTLPNSKRWYSQSGGNTDAVNGDGYVWCRKRHYRFDNESKEYWPSNCRATPTKLPPIAIFINVLVYWMKLGNALSATVDNGGIQKDTCFTFLFSNEREYSGVVRDWPGSVRTCLDYEVFSAPRQTSIWLAPANYLLLMYRWSDEVYHRCMLRQQLAV